MAASSKFDLSSSSSDGLAANSIGHRIVASIPSSSSTPRSSFMSTQGVAASLLQTIVSDMKTVGVFDQKLSRPGEFKRSLSSVLGVCQGDALPATFSMRHLPPSSAEEIRRLRNNLHDGSLKARDRAKAFGKAALNIDKCYNVLSRKRSRIDTSSSERSNAVVPGVSTPTMAPQSHFTASSIEAGSQKSEERTKSGAPSRKIRSSLLEIRMDARPNSVVRPSGSMDRDRDAFKPANSSATPPEEKGRALATTVDGWEKSKMKKKRSVIKPDASGNAVLARPHDGDRESKRGTQQKLITEARPRLSSAHGFRRPSGCEENYTGSPTSVMKMNTSVRGPRSNSGSLSKTASPNMNSSMGNSDDWEHPNSINKPNSIVGAVNRKRSTSARSSSPPVARWGGQRVQKMTRVARRSNLPPVVSSSDDFAVSEMQDTATVNDDGQGFTRRSSANASQQSKLSESEESGVVDKMSKDKIKKCSEMEEKVAVTVLNSRKSKVVTEEDNEDSIRRHAKIHRCATPASCDMPVLNEKLDGVSTKKQMRSARVNHENIESKPGRPTKKWSERKGHTRPKHSLTGAPSLDLAGESDDDHEELLAAANAALNSRLVCLNSSWKQYGEIFRFVCAEDQEFLNQQIHLSDELVASSGGTGDDQRVKCDLEYNSPSMTPFLLSEDGYGGTANGTVSLNECKRVAGSASQLKHEEPFLEELVLGNGAQLGVSICQALLSAIIEEEEVENFYHKNNTEEDHMYENVFGIQFEVDAEFKPKILNLQSLGTFQASDRDALYSCNSNTGWGYHDEPKQEDLGSNGALDDVITDLAFTSSPICTEFQYSQMCISDRILLELCEIGIYPEPVPALAQIDDEDIGEGIYRLTWKLNEQVLKKKRLLLELEKAVTEARASQQRELERIALDKLVGMAYDKYMVCWGPSASGSKNMNRSNKKATLAFVRRTLARYRRFEETGTSCFGEPAFKDMFFSMDSRPLTSSLRSKISLEERNHGDVRNKYSDTFRSVNHLSEQTCGREEQWSNKLKKKELLLDEVVGNATGLLRETSGLGVSLVSGTKGKRSERDREGKGQNRDTISRNGTAKIGRPAVSNVKGERKNKSKPKQKLTQLSDSANGLIGKATEMPNKISPAVPRSHDIGGSAKKEEDVSNDAETMDLINFQLPEIDVGDFGGQGQDIGSWLNIEDDVLQDLDFMGLEIPMDDLSEVNMMF